MHKFVPAFLLLTACAPSGAQTIDSVDETRALCEQAAQSFSEGDYEATFNVLRPFWPLPTQEIDNLTYQTASQAQILAGRFGEPVGTDYASTSTAGDSFVRHIYLVKFERHAVRFICVFYKPDENWLVNQINWDDQTALLFE